MLIKIILCCVCVLSTSAIAGAADLPSKVASPVPAITPQANWSGFYLGLQAGLARSTDTHSDLDYWYFNHTNIERSSNAPAFGIKAGYDQSFGSVIAGVVSEVSTGNFKAGKEVSPLDPSYNIRSQANFLGSLRGKLGVGVSDIALYATAGVAFSNTKHKYNETDGSGEHYNSSGKTTGWVVGLGADYAINSKTSVGLELSHYNFGSAKHELLDTSNIPVGYFFKQRNSYETLMLNLTQRF